MSSKDKLVGIGLPILNKKLLVINGDIEMKCLNAKLPCKLFLDPTESGLAPNWHWLWVSLTFFSPLAFLLFLGLLWHNIISC